MKDQDKLKTEVELQEYYEGIGCRCFARSREECACDSDWTPTQVYILRNKVQQLTKERDAAVEKISDELQDLIDIFGSSYAGGASVILVDDVRGRIEELQSQNTKGE